MIRYKPGQFLTNLVHFYRSYVLKKLLWFSLVMLVLTTVFVVIKMKFWPHEDMGFHISAFSMLGITISLLLVFRTNSAYDRWWEGRKQWGALVNNARNLAVMLHSLLPPEDEKNRSFFAKYISNFCISLVEHLRNGVKVDELIHLTPQEIQEYHKKQHLPNFISTRIFARAQKLYRDGTFTGEDILNLKPQMESFLDILGACERIKKTPIPFSFNVFLKIMVLSFNLALPVGLVDSCGWMTIPLSGIVFFAMMGVDMLAGEIEDPFGLDCNDLPTGTIAHTIKGNVYEIFSFPDEVEHENRSEPAFEKIF